MTVEPEISKVGAENEDASTSVIDSPEGLRILCISNARGALCQINSLVEKHQADAVIHTGSFGFFDGDSADSMARDVLADAANCSPVVNGQDFHEMNEEHLRESVGSQLSELPLFLAHAQQFTVPVYTIWGSSEDISVIEKFRDGTYNVPKLHLVDERSAPLIPNTSIRLLGLPGQFKKSWLFDIADGTTVPGRAGSTWTGIWQIGELLHTFTKTYDPKEVRLFMSSTGPLEKPLLNYIALAVRAQFTLSASKQRYTSSFSDSVVYEETDTFTRNLWSDKVGMFKRWNHAKPIVMSATEESPEQRDLISSTIDFLVRRDVDRSAIEQALKTKWNFTVGGDLSSGVVLNFSAQSGIDASLINEAFKLQDIAKEERHSIMLWNNEKHNGDRSTEDDNSRLSDSYEKFGEEFKNKEARQEKLKAKRERAKAKKEFLKSRNEEDSQNGKESSPVDSSNGISDESVDGSTKDLDNKDLDSPDYSRRTSLTGSDTKSLDGSASLKNTNKKVKQKRVKEKKKQRDTEDTVVRRPGLWFKNGDRSPEEILGFLADQDRNANPRVEFNSSVKPNGLKSKVALVFFDTPEQASGAYERVDKDAAGTVSIYQPEQHRPRRPFSKGRKL